MKQYIKQTEKGRICTHPKVTKFWEWGGGPASGPFMNNASIILEDGTECNFKCDANDAPDSIEQLNNFLNTLSE